jgi:sarcosine oxidase subunit alpha
MATPSAPVYRTPLHDWHAAQGARFNHRNGWLIPAAYPAHAGEAGSVLADISSWAKISFQGPGVPALTEALLGESAASKPRGVVAFEADGPGLACRPAADRLLLLGSTGNTAAFDERLARVSISAGVVRSDVTMALAGFLLGNEPWAILRQLTSLDVSRKSLPPGSCAETGLAGVHALLIRPSGESDTSVRIYVAWDLAEYVWERLLEAGRAVGIRPVGLDELNAVGLKG